jgi:hypothetical protein
MKINLLILSLDEGGFSPKVRSHFFSNGRILFEDICLFTTILELFLNFFKKTLLFEEITN